jgi:hypothetical protein
MIVVGCQAENLNEVAASRVQRLRQVKILTPMSGTGLGIGARSGFDSSRLHDKKSFQVWKNGGQSKNSNTRLGH